MLKLSVLFLSLVACKHTPPKSPGTPVLASPIGELYTTARAAPADPLVGWVVQEHELTWYDDVLSGAAAGLGLRMVDEAADADMAGARWAGFAAGWPYAIESVNTQLVVDDTLPEELIKAIPQLRQPGQSMGLSRVHGPDGDLWVLMFSTTPGPMAAWAREQQVGAVLDLPLPGAPWSAPAWQALSPDLQPMNGPSLDLDTPGEWVIELTATDPNGARKVLVQVPLYVGMATPDDAPLLKLEGTADTPELALAQAVDAVDVLRDLDEAPTLQEDPLLSAVARKEVRRLADGGAPSRDQEQRLRAAGFPEGPVAEISCEASSVSACVDELFWRVQTRRDLLAPAYNLGGVGVALQEDRVRLVLTMATESAAP